MHIPPPELIELYVKIYKLCNKIGEYKTSIKLSVVFPPFSWISEYRIYIITKLTDFYKIYSPIEILHRDRSLQYFIWNGG